MSIISKLENNNVEALGIACNECQCTENLHYLESKKYINIICSDCRIDMIQNENVLKNKLTKARNTFL